jgi:hypothetical protein
MTLAEANEIFTAEVLDELLPLQRSDEFFEALLGDSEEGAYDIHLAFKDYDPDRKTLLFELELHERPGKCLACNLTYGLPEVFSRHPLLNLYGMVKKIETLLGGRVRCESWELGTTQNRSEHLHVIPLTIQLN